MGALQPALPRRATPLGLDARRDLATLRFGQMCNLYSITTNQDAIRRLFGALNSNVGNLPPMPGVFPDYREPVTNHPTQLLRCREKWRVRRHFLPAAG
jgi:hypothetical protein